jgi:hypothetical protein
MAKAETLRFPKEQRDGSWLPGLPQLIGILLRISVSLKLKVNTGKSAFYTG